MGPVQMSLVPASSFVSAGQRFAVLAYEQTVPDRLLRWDRAQMSKKIICVYLLKAIRIKYRAPCCLHAPHSLHLKRSTWGAYSHTVQIGYTTCGANMDLPLCIMSTDQQGLWCRG
jgi:hypothetical protein